MAAMWKCAGCGIEGPDKARRCDCATNVVVSSDGVGAWKERDPAVSDRLAVAMLRSMAASFRGGFDFSFDPDDMAALLIKVADRIDPGPVSSESK